MNKKMKNNHKLYVFLSMFKEHIYLEIVQNRWVVISSVKNVHSKHVHNFC
jgi:hypothetical protein